MAFDQRPGDELAKYAPQGSILTSENQSMTLMRSFFAAEEGELQPGQHLKLALCMSGGGSIRYRPNSNNTLFHWNPGRLFLTAPDDDSKFATPDVDMIGLAVDLSAPEPAYSVLSEWALRTGQLARMFDDEVMQSILVALWSSADLHASSSVFIEHGVEIILQRALTLEGTPQAAHSVIRLSRREMALVTDYIDANLSENIRIVDLSKLVGMTTNRFSKTLQATIGLAPYAYLTTRRMDMAKTLLTIGTPATETALTVGYTNPSKFSAAFKRVVGCTPSEWKRKRQ